MTAPSQGLPAPLFVHVLDAAGNELSPSQIPATGVAGNKGKSNMTFLRFELWSTVVDNVYWQGELHLFLRLT